MNKANECTCPSGDGSLVHPCPAHPAVEQAGANVGHGHVFPRADGVKMRCGGPGLCSECTADASRARAALAQPSPAPELAERGTQHRFSTTEQTCRHDFAGVWWNDNGETKTGKECRECGFFIADIAEAPELERPEVVGYLATAEHPKHGQPHKAFNYFKDQHDAQVAHWRERGCTVTEDRLMTVSQHERIVEARWNRAMDLMGEHVARISEKFKAERDSALARVAELERQEPVVRAYGVLPPFAEKVLAKLRRFYECAEDFESGGVDIGRHWLDLLTQLGLLNRVQRSPAFWEISQQGEDLLEAPVAQAQHSVPLNAAALVAAEGRKYSLNAAGMFDSGAPEHAQTFAIVQLLSEFDDEEAESHWEAIMAYSDLRTSDALWRVAELLAAAPGNSAQHSVPEGWMLVECGIWTQEQVDEMQKTVTRFRNSEFVDDRALAMAVADAGQCKAPEISLAELLAAAPGKEGV
ncbi:hypothetical protein I5F55_03635 [Pseudomonas aeruginosa]|nr:hypothetical protein [Pseudomonas aeruginosa]